MRKILRKIIRGIAYSVLAPLYIIALVSSLLAQEWMRTMEKVEAFLDDHSE